jgi:hypothetical protein
MQHLLGLCFLRSPKCELPKGFSHGGVYGAVAGAKRSPEYADGPAQLPGTPKIIYKLISKDGSYNLHE